MRFLFVFFAFMAVLWSCAGFANVIITGTRIIYPAQNKEIGIELTNVESTPALLQAWITQEDGDNTKPVPFVITPPIFRMEGNKKQTLRLIYTHESLPKDRESLFYFHLLDIPPMPTGEDKKQNYLQISLLSKLKLFFRPSGLKPAIEKAPYELSVHLNQNKLTIKNPTPYHMTISGVSLLANKDDIDAIVQLSDVPMIEPFGQTSVNLNTDTSPNHATIAQLEIINDFGGKVKLPLMLSVS